MKTIIFSLAAAKDFDALPRDARETIQAGLHRYAISGQGDVNRWWAARATGCGSGATA